MIMSMMILCLLYRTSIQYMVTGTFPAFYYIGKSYRKDKRGKTPVKIWRRYSPHRYKRNKGCCGCVGAVDILGFSPGTGAALREVFHFRLS
jgi:uncharacterized membrane protein YesL